MPFGVDKDLGGDTKKNDAWMEKCVQKVMATGKDKGSAIAICKASMKKAHEKMKGDESSSKFLTYAELALESLIIKRV